MATEKERRAGVFWTTRAILGRDNIIKLKEVHPEWRAIDCYNHFKARLGDKCPTYQYIGRIWNEDKKKRKLLNLTPPPNPQRSLLSVEDVASDKVVPVQQAVDVVPLD